MPGEPPSLPPGEKFLDTGTNLVTVKPLPGVKSQTVAEAENTRLDDGGTPAWLRVASYWRDSGLLPRMAAFDGSNDCTYAGANRYSTVQCRGFVVDQPWSAA